MTEQTTPTPCFQPWCAALAEGKIKVLKKEAFKARCRPGPTTPESLVEEVDACSIHMKEPDHEPGRAGMASWLRNQSK